MVEVPEGVNKWVNFEAYLRSLAEDIYAQPKDDGHTAFAIQALNSLLPTEISNVLDVGCGQGFLSPIFAERGIHWTGVTLGPDATVCQAAGLNVEKADVSFLPFENESFDLVFARHILEHSPFPILTLMEWRRVSRNWLLLVAPAPDYWTYSGKNHYSVTIKEQLVWWLGRAGWEVVNEEVFDNSNPFFLKRWRADLIDVNLLSEKSAETHFPKEAQAVEYRLLCVRAEEITE